MTKEQATASVARLNALKTAISRAAWSIDDALFQLRLAEVGESGIVDRQIGDPVKLREELDLKVKVAELTTEGLCREYLWRDK